MRLNFQAFQHRQHLNQSSRCQFLASRCFLLATRCFLLATRCFLLATRRFLLTTRCFLLTTRCLLLATRCFLLAIRCFLLATRCFLLTTRCLLLANRCHFLPNQNLCQVRRITFWEYQKSQIYWENALYEIKKKLWCVFYRQKLLEVLERTHEISLCKKRNNLMATK